MTTQFILTLRCPDAVGIIASITGCLAEHRGFILEAAHHAEPDSGELFGRIEFHLDENPDALPDLEGALAKLARELSMEWRMVSALRRCRTLIAVSKVGHCLNDLLYRARTGGLNVDVLGVVSNHETLREAVENEGIPFHHLPIGDDGKGPQEAQLLKLFEQSGADLLVLARYMQILSGDACERLKGRAVNIHHSFLPGFKGARPYHQAYARGVKLIGATAHYVTAELDDGPIIDQAVSPVDHTKSPAEFAAIGQDLESLVLARAVRYFAEHRVLVSGSRTVVFA